jgi:chorismate mutase / prephenate dehydratase
VPDPERQPVRPAERRRDSPELRRLRRRIDALDRRIVRLLNERASLALVADSHKAAAGRSAVRDPVRERDVLDRVTAEASRGPLPVADLLGLYRRLIAATRRLQAESRRLEEAARRGYHRD